MTNEQRIAQLEQTNRQWEAWYKAQQMQPKKGGAFEAKFFAFLLILSIFAIGYLTEQWNRAGEHSAKAMTKTARK